MSEPCKEFEAQVVSHNLIHDDNPVMTWQANNTIVVMDPAGNVKPDKKASRKRIDGVVASIMAVGRGMQAIDEPDSIYETGGIHTIGA